jgi:transketolase
MTEKIATREAYGKALAKFGENKEIVVLDADLACSTKSADFMKKYPERFFNVGVAEANMIGISAGLAACGKIPFASTFAVFATGRVYDQLRCSVCYPNIHVIVAGSHAGLMTGEDGATHQALEDMALTRALPNMRVICPADATETEKAVEYLIKAPGPFYLRLSRPSVPIIFGDDYKFEFGKGRILKEGNDITIFACGIMTHKALEAAELLKANGISSRIVNICTIKPIDKDLILKCAKETKAILTAEDHGITGGLGSAVAEVLSENYPVKMKRIGVQDRFGESGKPEELLEKYGLTASHIVKAAEELLEDKR